MALIDTGYWNYDHGLWAVGSINGFVCPLSATIFGVGALGLAYLVLKNLGEPTAMDFYRSIGMKYQDF